MKHVTRIVPAFALVAALIANAPAQDASPAPKKQACIDAQIDASLDNLSDLVSDPDIMVAKLELLQIQLCTPVVDAEPMPLDPTLGAVIEAVIRSARIGFMTHFDAAFVREQVIEARLDRVLRVLEQRAKSTGWDEMVYREVVAQLVVRARVAVGYPNAEAARARLHAILDGLRTGPRPHGPTFDALRLELIRARLFRYLQFLTKRARILGLERKVVQPYLAMLVERARLIAIAK